MEVDFLLPELGENIAGGDVLRVLVQVGETIARDQPVLELETDKATIEVPASVAGRITALLVKEGQKVKVGEAVLKVDAAEDAATTTAAPGPAAAIAEIQKATADAYEMADAIEPNEDAPEAMTAQPAVPVGPVEFRLPSLGENVASGEVLRILVGPGDEVTRDQALLELETDKATIEVPSSLSGRVLEVRVKEGATVKVDDVVFLIEAAGAAPAAPPPFTVQRVHAASGPDGAGEPRQTAAAEDKPGMLENALAEAQAESAFRAGTARGAVVTLQPREGAPKRLAPAAPSVRRVARELGVDINKVAGTEQGGRISAEDVRAHVKRVMSSGGPRPPAEMSPLAAPPALPDFAKWGAIERKPMRAVRRKTAAHLSRAWVTVPHVTQCDKADITDLEDLRARFAARAEAAGGKLTVTAIALKIVAAALKKFPQFNASVDMAAEEIVFKQYVHIGVAVDTDRGLLVPVVRDADTRNIFELSIELAKAADRARAGKVSMEDLEGGCFTITNLGGIGGTYFTPIVNHPEVAILGLSRARTEPVWKDGAFQPRLMLPLSLSYDHRVIDGADGIRFLRWVADAFEQPFLLSLEG